MRRLAWVLVIAAGGAMAIPGCDGDDQKRKVIGTSEGGAGGEAPSAAGAGGDSVGPGGASPRDGGGESGRALNEDGGEAGASSTPSCEEVCREGACVLGQCLGRTTVEGSVNLTTTSLSEGRSCGEAPAYSVTALVGKTAQLLTAVDPDCLAPGDEVLLINLQGAPGAVRNVGSWELLRLATVEGAAVTFVEEKQRFYGAADDDDGLGTAPGTQRVALVRVPRFGVLEVTESGRISAEPWDGRLGGVVALRAGRLTLAGSIDASALGYRAGRWSEDNIVCFQSIATEAGESISGLGTASLANNEGASGGLGAGNADFNSNTPVMATPGHASSGEPGANGGARPIGSPGGAYGDGSGARLTMGSGPGGGLRCTEEDHPPRLVGFPGQAGGIVLLLADEVDVLETGSISASPPPAARDVAFAGGYVSIRGGRLALGADRVTARGSLGGGINGPTATFRNRGSAGYIALQARDVQGSTDPAAAVLP